jgi:hypothetical protein
MCIENYLSRIMAGVQKVLGRKKELGFPLEF